LPLLYSSPFTFGRRDLPVEGARYAFLGIPYDSSASYRPGARFAPNAIREASREIEDYDLLEDFDLTELRIADAGDVEVSFGDYGETRKRVRESLRQILDAGAIPVSIGGEHGITPPILEAYREKPFYLVFDAHLDFREEYLGNPFSHACTTRRAGEIVGFENLLVVGVRSGGKGEVSSARSLRAQFLPIDACRNREKVKERIRETCRGKEVYLSIDADVLDPGTAPGVTNPEPPGFDYSELVDLLRLLEEMDLVGLDLVEVTPLYDPYTPILAAKLLFKALLFHGKGRS
jgi:agmatinase